VRSHLLPHAAALSAGVKARRRLAAAAAAGAKERTVIARNRRARHDYHIEDVVEAGLVLTGTEVKSLRAGRASLTDGFAQISDGEMWLHGVHIPEYAQGTWTNHEPRRPRKLLLHRKEIDRLASDIAERGFTLVPLSLYFSGGRAKVELALARDMILVTNNASDFCSLYAAQELHPGLVILVPNVERETPIAVVPCGARSAARDRGIGE